MPERTGAAARANTGRLAAHVKANRSFFMGFRCERSGCLRLRRGWASEKSACRSSPGPKIGLSFDWISDSGAANLPGMRLPSFWVFLVLVAGVSGLASAGSAQDQSAAGAALTFKDAGPVALARERQFDFTSRINGQAYRLMISAPISANRAGAYPVFYVLDGNWYFRELADTATWGSGEYEPAVVVGIGYPTEDNAEVRRRRTLEMTLALPPAASPSAQLTQGDAFLQVIDREVKPFIASRYRVDPARQIIYGKSSAGLMVLRALFRNPGAFSSYIAASPSIGSGNRVVLADEPAFSARARRGELHLKLLLTSAGDEQYDGPDPKLLAAQGRTIADVSDLAARLAVLDPQNVRVVRTIFADESHRSVSPATLSRAVVFALEPPAATRP